MSEGGGSSGTTSSVPELFGDPAGLAEHQFRLALDLCTDCRDYHALWPYRRLSRTLSGIEATADIVMPILRDVVRPDGRVLIAGSADAGLLALTVRATKTLTPFIEVADRCPTPLAVCRRYAETHGLSISTLQLDFTAHALPRRYDVIYADCVLQFVPRTSHTDVLRRLREAMTGQGALVILERARVIAGGARRPGRAAEFVDALVAQGVELPEDKAAFQLRLNAALEAQRARLADCLAPEGDLAVRLVEAGFRIHELAGYERQRAVPLRNGDSVEMRIIVAVPA